MIIYHGSTKEIRKKNNQLIFHFTDDYSVFDYGKMPNKIPKKGQYLASMATYWFKVLHNPKTYQSLLAPDFIKNPLDKTLLTHLQKNGAKTHFIKRNAKREITVKEFKVIDVSSADGNYDYDKFKSAPEKCTIPLECIFRFGAPLGSSLLDKNSDIVPNTLFDSIKIEFTTKLEKKDRKLSVSEAVSIASLTKLEFQKLNELIKIYASVLWHGFNSKGVMLWDGKFEFAFGKRLNPEEREIILIDSIGPDELRLTFEGIPLSKEFLRQAYRETNWYQAWKKGENSDPPTLKNKTIKMAKDIYKGISQLKKVDRFSLGEKSLKKLKRANQHVVILGKGGREHSLATAIAQSSDVKRVTVIPGNPGMNEGKIRACDLRDEKWIKFCQNEFVSYVVIGPEDLISAGWGDRFRAENIPCLSPSKKASILESSKAFSKQFMQKYKIPTANFQIFSDSESASFYVEESDQEEFVVKKSGLAAGKGVYICHSKSEAFESVQKIKDDEIVIEELINGPEISFFALCDGTDFLTLGTACDYKRLLDGDKGPNTGGMGCYSPAHWLKPKDIKKIEKRVLKPTLKGMKKEGLRFKGVLFIGLMKTNKGFKVLEYNVRFGDPETQTLLPRIKEGFHEACYLTAKGKLNQAKIKLSHSHSIHLVKASKNYPYQASSPSGIENSFEPSKSSILFYAGVKAHEQKLIADGGRVLGITCLSKDLDSARQMVYEKAKQISFSGEQFRKDIGL